MCGGRLWSPGPLRKSGSAADLRDADRLRFDAAVFDLMVVLPVAGRLAGG